MPKPHASTALSRERNRIHARKTRQRKKEQMSALQNQAEELKEEQIKLKQSINEKNTASILVGLFGNNKNNSASADPKVEELLRRPVEQIPDSTKLSELPALILPGQHNSKKNKGAAAVAAATIASEDQSLPDDGIDYDLLGKDRSKCSAEELDRIRRERNRMHAKRTRDRKRLFMEEMAELCKNLEQENFLLKNHLNALNGLPPLPAPPVSTAIPSSLAAASKKKKAAVKVSPALTSSPSTEVPPPMDPTSASTNVVSSPNASPAAKKSKNKSSVTSGPLRSQMQAFHKKRSSPASSPVAAAKSKKKKTKAAMPKSVKKAEPIVKGDLSALLQAAGAFHSSASPVSAENSDHEHSPSKRQRIDSTESEESSPSHPHQQHKALPHLGATTAVL
jgi:hypothetical protein